MSQNREPIITILALGVLTSGLSFAQLTIQTPDGPNVCAGGQLRLDATEKDINGNDVSAANVRWLGQASAGTFGDDASAKTTFRARESASPGPLTISAQSGIMPPISITITITPKCDQGLGGEIVRAVVGFDQIGASGTPSGQAFSFDFFISRPLPGSGKNPTIWGSHVRWWGDIKVGSFPYTQNSSLTSFAQTFATTFGNQTVNKLAESIGFAMGPEFRIWQSSSSFGSLTDKTSAARFALNLYGGVGATGPNNPLDNVTVFQSPVAGSTQADLLSTLTGVSTCTPSSTITCTTKSIVLCPASPTTCSNYIALVPRSADRFLQQWGAGFRLYTLFTNTDGSPTYAAPATVEFSVGQDATVTESHLHNFVGHVAAMYPFSIGNRNDPKSIVIYLFGEVTAAFAKNHYQSTLTLTPAVDSNKNPIAVNDPGVTQIPVEANRRDIYRIGVGIDLISVWNKLTSVK